MKKIVAALLAVMMILVSCSFSEDATGTGTLRVVFADRETRGFHPASVDTDHYVISVKNTKSQETFSFTADAVIGSASCSVKAGPSEIWASAYTQDGHEIGTSPIEKMDIIPNANNNVTLSVSEKEGTGSLRFSIKTSVAGRDLKVRIFRAGDDIGTAEPIIPEFTLDRGNEGYTWAVSIPNGFYTVIISDSEGKAVFPETAIRMFAGSETVYDAAIDDSWKVKVSITHSIVPTPEVSIVLSNDNLLVGEELVVTVSAPGMENPVFKWYMDNEEIAGETSLVLRMDLPTDELIGKHTVKCQAFSKSLVWQAEKDFFVSAE